MPQLRLASLTCRAIMIVVKDNILQQSICFSEEANKVDPTGTGGPSGHLSSSSSSSDSDSSSSSLSTSSSDSSDSEAG